MEADDYAALYLASLRVADQKRPRSQQAAQGRVGISDLFGCKEKVRRMVTGDPAGREPLSMKAWIGSAIHEKAATDRVTSGLSPNIRTEVPVVVTLPNGAQVPGTADEIDPDEPSCTDLKTEDGLAVIRQTGSSDNQRSQRHVYYGAAVQMGLLPENGIVRNLWADRSGRYDEFHVEQESYDPAVLHAASVWLDDVMYAVRNQEPAERNPKMCGFCRFSADNGGSCGADFSRDGQVLTEEQAWAARILGQSREASKLNTEEQEDAKRFLVGVDGVGHGWQVWHTNVNRDSGSHVITKVRRVVEVA